MKRILVILAILSIATSASASVLLINGDFESGNVGWVGYGNAPGIGGGGFGIVPFGTKCAANVASYGNFDGGQYQQVLIPTAGLYTLGAMLQAADNNQFAYLGGQASMDTSTYATLGVDLAGGTSFAAATKGPNVTTGFMWASAPALAFTTTSANQFVTIFVNLHATWANAGNWAAADNVTLGAVPEPGSILALMTGMVGLAGFAIRRRK